MIQYPVRHTQGHQILYFRLAHTGDVVLSGGLYHYPEERTLDRVAHAKLRKAPDYYD